MEERFFRTAMLLGEEAVKKLENSRILLLGLGGVGGYALEALARAGVGELYLLDADTVSVSNINRQILADDTTVGREKTAVAAERVARINPAARVHTITRFLTDGDAAPLLAEIRPDYVIDAIDTVAAKVDVIRAAKEMGIPIISCMGTGNKLAPEKLTVADITKTHTCPLARSMRARLREAGVAHVDVLFSSETPRTPALRCEEEGRVIPTTVSYVPAVAGMMLGGYVIRRLIGEEI